MSLKQLGKLLIKYGGPTVRQGLDTVTNPKTYQGLAKNVDDVLQRRIPQSGVNIQNAPMSLLGKVNDIFDMPPGRAKEEARNQLQRGFRMADRLSKGAPAPREGLSSTGALRAPGVGPQVPRRPGLSPVSTTPARPSFNAQDFRDIGGPQLRSSLRQTSTAIPSKGRLPSGFAQAPTKLAGAGGGPSLMNLVAPGQNPFGRAWGLGMRGLNAVGVYEGGKRLLQGDIKGGVGSLAMSFPGRTLGLASKVLGGTGVAAIAKPLIGATALLALTPGSGGNSTMDDYYKTLTPEQKEKFQNDIRSEQENMSDPQKRKMGITPADPLVTRLPDSSPFVPDSNNLPSSPEAVVANPLQQKMAEYEQGRAKATTQEEMDAVRDLGMSIHQAANPQMYEESYNPLMAATFPERYTKTPEDFIVQGGIQAPRGMSDKDARQATAFGNKIQTMQSADDEQSRLAKALASVKAARRYPN
jgi:hypothetical protein